MTHENKISPDCVSQQALYLELTRTGPGVLGFKPTGGAYYEKRFADIDEAVAQIATSGERADTWVSMATYPLSATSRDQRNAERLCSMWLDVDAHAGGKYRCVAEVEDALLAFLENTDLPSPSLLTYSGHGIHAIWTFTQAIPRSEWQPVATKLQDLGARLELGADPITADAARILRVPGTLNFRDSESPVMATLVETGAGHHDFDDVAAAIDEALEKLPVEMKPSAKPKPDIPRSFDSPGGERNAELVRAMLSAIDPDVEYETWRDVVWAVAATDWDCAYDLAHEWSASGDKWEDEAFDRVWNSYLPARGIGFGTLVHHAREGGYSSAIPSKKTAKAEPSIAPGRLITICAADIKPEHVEWLVELSFPLGMLAVIGGEPGLGKSQIAINLAAGVTTGRGLPGNAEFANLGSVIILANEDDAARTIRPRLDAAGADIAKVHIVEGVAREGAEVALFQLDEDVSDLREKALQIGDVKLIIIDPPSAYLGTKVDSYKDSDVRRVLMPLGRLAQETGAMILLIVHLNKRTDGGAQQRFSGSTAWTAAPRVGFMAIEDPLTKQRFMLPVKNNVGDDRLGYQYRIAEKLIPYGHDTIKSSYVVWDQTTTRPVSELIAPKKPRGSVVDDARGFLEQELADGPLPVDQIKSSAQAAGITWSSVTRAKKEIPIASTRVTDGWVWTLIAVKERSHD